MRKFICTYCEKESETDSPHRRVCKDCKYATIKCQHCKQLREVKTRIGHRHKIKYCSPQCEEGARELDYEWDPIAAKDNEGFWALVKTNYRRMEKKGTTIHTPTIRRCLTVGCDNVFKSNNPGERFCSRCNTNRKTRKYGLLAEV